MSLAGKVFGRTGRQVCRAAFGHGWRHLWFGWTHKGNMGLTHSKWLWVSWGVRSLNNGVKIEVSYRTLLQKQYSNTLSIEPRLSSLSLAPWIPIDTFRQCSNVRLLDGRHGILKSQSTSPKCIFKVDYEKQYIFIFKYQSVVVRNQTKTWPERADESVVTT